MDALSFLEQARKGEPQSVYVLHGDEDFLRRQVLDALRNWILGSGEDTSFGMSSFPGEKVLWSTVLEELQTLPFLSPRRMVVIEQADPFVTAHRSLLEKYISAPAASGILVLEVKSWPSNTRLYRLLDGPSSLGCKALAGAKLAEWCRRWAQSQHGKQLTLPASQLLIDLVGAEMGLLAQEIGKLSVNAGDGVRIDTADVDLLVGQNRAENTFKILDLIGQGDTAAALSLLDRLLTQGERPLQLLGAFGWQLRKLAQAGRLYARLGVPLNAALQQAGIPPFKLREGDQQVRHLGRRRLDRLYDWLLEADLGMKGESALPERIQLERLILRLSLPSSPPPDAQSKRR